MDLSAFSLAGRTALVTGAGRGIGRALALGLAGAGAGVVVTDIEGASAARVADEVATLGVPARAHALDVTDVDALERVVAWSEDAVGPVDVLVNNAGIRERTTDALATTADDWDQVLAVNARGPFLLAQAVARRMIARGSGGSIVNIASQLGLVGFPGRPAYTASKAALINLTRSLAVEWAPHRIRVNALAPGPIRTEFTEWLYSDPEINARYQAATPLGAFQSPSALVGAAVYLASPASSWTTGSVLVVDGGYTAR